jgi:mono/diheme cytochrome c family protein
MKKGLKILGIVVGVLVALLLVAVGGVYATSRSRQSAHFTPAISTFEIPTDAASIAEGDRLFDARGCSDCHGENAGGRVRIDDPALGRIVSANLTHFASADAQSWSRAVRDGLRADGTPLVFMPAVELNPMPDRELGAIIAYVRTLPQVDDPLPETTIGPVARAIDVLAGGLPLFTAHDVDHARRPADIAPGRSLEMGAYISRGCMGCHGEHFSGGPIPGAPPEMGTPRNLTFHESGLAGWTEADLRTALREGRTPDGGTLNPEQMPWRIMSAYLSDEEIGSLYDHLQTVPHRPEGER